MSIFDRAKELAKDAAVAFMVAVAATLSPRTAGAQSASTPLTTAAIRAILAERIDTQKQSVGIVVGVVDADGRRIVSHGRLARTDDRAPDGDTVFEIGSVTKVFTSLLLALEAERDALALDTPVSRVLAKTVAMPSRGRAITLADLATHTSGLPRLPANLAPKDPTNPYAGYTTSDLFSFLSSYALTRDVGAQYEYSNLGAGLLGQALVAFATSPSYESLVSTRITGPLGMSSTAITLDGGLTLRKASGHDGALQPTPYWDLAALEGAGALRSTANDMLTFVSAALGLQPSPFSKAFALMTSVRRPTPLPNTEVGLGWHITVRNGRTIVWHNGGTGGFRSYIGYDPVARRGVVALSNTGTAAGVDDIGRHILDSSYPLAAPPASATLAVVPQAAEALERLVGRYELAPGAALVVTRKDQQLFAQLASQPAFEVFPTSPREFFYKVVEARLTFELGSTGPATAVVLHQSGKQVRGARVQ